MPNPMICTIPHRPDNPILRAFLESGAALQEVVAPLEPHDWAPPQKPASAFTGNRHERRAQAARARKT